MTDISDIRGTILSMIGDVAGTTWTDTVLDNCIRAALGRYSAAVETIKTQCFQLATGGQFALSLANWPGTNPIQEVVYVHWPAVSTVALTVGENKIIDWWYYKSWAAEFLFLDVQVEGDTLPAMNDYILVRGVVPPLLDGLDGSTTTSVPETHFYVLSMGAAAYALRSKESQINIKSSAAGYESAYHVGMLAEMANDYQAEFEKEILIIREKRLEHPPWGIAERKRLRRIGN